MKKISLVKVLEENPQQVVYVKYGDNKERQMKVDCLTSGWPGGKQIFRSNKIDWIAVSHEGTPYLLGYGAYDWLTLLCKVPGKTEGRLLRQYSNKLYSNERLEAVGTELTPELLNLFTARIGAFLPHCVFVRTIDKRLSIATLDNAGYKYEALEPSEFFVCANIIPVVRLQKDTLIEAGSESQKAKKIWLPFFHNL